MANRLSLDDHRSPRQQIHAYSIATSEMLKWGCTSKGVLETNIERWVLLGQIIPTVHHFLSRLRFLTSEPLVWIVLTLIAIINTF